MSNGEMGGCFNHTVMFVFNLAFPRLADDPALE
jgi:hypothetical protein